MKMHRIENLVDDGMPDVLYTYKTKTGLIELKEINRLPTNKLTHVNFDFRPSQKPWHKAWADWGGTSFLLVQVTQPREYIFIYGADVMECEEWNTHQLYQRCALVMRPYIEPSKVCKLLG